MPVISDDMKNNKKTAFILGRSAVFLRVYEKVLKALAVTLCI